MISIFQITMLSVHLRYSFVCTDMLPGFWQQLQQTPFSIVFILLL